MKHITTLFKRPWAIFGLLFLAAFPTLLPLFQPGYFSTQDYIYIARIFEMRNALMDGHFPVRWVPDFRYGEPLYNFYAPLPYYLGAFIRIVSEALYTPFSYILITKILFVVGFFGSVVSMYLLGKALFGKWGGFVTALLYLYAPYHSVDLYVRGAISEAYALIIFPLIFLSIMRFAQSMTIRWMLALILSLSALFYTHNLMTLLFGPFILMWMGYWTLRSGFRVGLLLLTSLVFAVGLSSSYLLPAFFEKQYVQSSELTTGYFDFRGHFVAMQQWVVPSWGYGASLWGLEDGMSFQLGLVHWISFASAWALLLFILLKKKAGALKPYFNEDIWTKEKRTWLFMMLGVISAGLLLSLFMTHVRSAFIWERFSTFLSFAQFPWRFLGISIFFGSLFGGFIIYLFTEKYARYLVVIFLILIGVFYLQYFKTDVSYFDAEDEGYIGKKTITQEDKIPRDYLPTTVKDVKRERFEYPQFREGEGLIKDYSYKTAKVDFTVSTSTTSATVEVPVTYFPGWYVETDTGDGKMLETDRYGLIRLHFTQAKEHHVMLRFGNTLVRTIGNTISIVSLLFLITLLYVKRKNAKV